MNNSIYKPSEQLLIWCLQEYSHKEVVTKEGHSYTHIEWSKIQSYFPFSTILEIQQRIGELGKQYKFSVDTHIFQIDTQPEKEPSIQREKDSSSVQLDFTPVQSSKPSSDKYPTPKPKKKHKWTQEQKEELWQIANNVKKTRNLPYYPWEIITEKMQEVIPGIRIVQCKKGFYELEKRKFVPLGKKCLDLNAKSLLPQKKIQSVTVRTRINWEYYESALLLKLYEEHRHKPKIWEAIMPEMNKQFPDRNLDQCKNFIKNRKKKSLKKT